jgi:signal peptidase I
MKSINWDYVLVLVRSRYFVRDVVQYFKKPDLEWLFYSGADCLRDFIDVRDVYNNNFHDVKKSILLARDIIKMNDFKVVSSDSKFFWNIASHLVSYPRPTANDVYERNFMLEEAEAYERSICCMPYDCMCYEAQYDVGFPEIWTKVKGGE